MTNFCPFCWRQATELHEHIIGAFRREVATCLIHVKDGGEPMSFTPIPQRWSIEAKPPVMWKASNI
jgi:hypothetical protein